MSDTIQMINLRGEKVFVFPRKVKALLKEGWQTAELPDFKEMTEDLINDWAAVHAPGVDIHIKLAKTTMIKRIHDHFKLNS